MVGNFRDWSEFIELLTRHRVRFIIVGAHALAALGRPRHTGDLDVFIEPAKKNAERLGRTLRDFGFEGAADAAHLFAESGKMMRLGREPVRIDVTTEMSDLTFEEAWRGSFRRRVGRRLVRFLGRAEYIKNKRAAVRNVTVWALSPEGEPGDYKECAALLDTGATQTTISRAILGDIDHAVLPRQHTFVNGRRVPVALIAAQLEADDRSDGLCEPLVLVVAVSDAIVKKAAPAEMILGHDYFQRAEAIIRYTRPHKVGCSPKRRR